MKIQRINDERLIIKNLQNIRLVYVLQTLGIIGVLGYDFISYGLSSIKENPLWIVFIASIVILAFMSFGSDERLAFKNLQKIRVAFAVQLLGIVGILGYDWVTKGMDGMRENPLWLLFIISTLILMFLSMNISVDHEENKKSPGKGLAISTIVLLFISVATGILTVSIDRTASFLDGLLLGSILFVCGFISFLFIFRLRKSKE